MTFQIKGIITSRIGHILDVLLFSLNLVTRQPCNVIASLAGSCSIVVETSKTSLLPTYFSAAIKSVLKSIELVTREEDLGYDMTRELWEELQAFRLD